MTDRDVIDWRTCHFCPCSTICTENAALCQGWDSGPQESPGPMGFGDQWHIVEIVRLRAELESAHALLAEWMMTAVDSQSLFEMRARSRELLDRVA